MANHSFLQSDDSSHLALQHLSTGATSPDPSCSLSHSRGDLLPDATLISVTTGRALPSYNSHTRNPAELHEEGCITLASQSTSQLELNRRLSHHSPLDKLAILSSNPRKGATESPNSPNHYLPSPRRRRPVGPNLSPNTANDAFPVGSYPSLTALEVDCAMVPSEGKRKEGRTRGRMNFSPRTASPNTGMSQLE
ncbi:hypothetical protein AGDE_14663 [Angomonas deanei]|uniref:Uncharacterized protein n=1 Tax=Angomonas deanei TaxID=59799 RepID=A0A7G2CD15_9TRYP|nr:hypothetical protein AGDE_14663 [Angomonas deanei]CAD2217716.1 hypothetical protein, conserved [Angomonas deanei]|eukprot:EPY20455.1 hypothetical protein AGDE_14663 [Angomonas deanei]